MTETLLVQWSTLKTLIDSGAVKKTYYVTCDVGMNTYDLYAWNGVGRIETSVTGTDPGTNGREFNDTYKAKAVAVTAPADAYALMQPATNSLGARLVEVTSRISHNRSITIVTHDLSEPCTWWQGSTNVSNEELVDQSLGVFASAHSIWINVEHPKLFADELLDVASWSGAGFPSNLDPYYRSWWMPDSSLQFRNHYYPVIQVQPGGTGNWVTVDPNDSGSPSYGHTIDYELGKIHFNSIVGWPLGTKARARASYFYTLETAERSMFEVGPPVGKKWHLNITEVQLSVGSSWQDAVLFQGKQGGVVGTRARYKTYGNMQSTATCRGAVVLEGGIADTPQAWPAGPDNGWMYGGCSGLRNITKKFEADPWIYEKPFELLGSSGMRVAVCLASGKKFLDADIANVTLYVNEYDE